MADSETAHIMVSPISAAIKSKSGNEPKERGRWPSEVTGRAGFISFNVTRVTRLQSHKQDIYFLLLWHLYKS